MKSKMRAFKKFRMGERAAMLLYFSIIALFISSIAFLAIVVSEKPAKWEPRYVGEHQLALLKTAVNAEKFLLYVDQAAKPTAVQSIYNLGQKGGLAGGSDCGQYLGYESWRKLSDEDGKNKIKNCFPDEITLKYDLAYAINNELYKYLNVYWGMQPSLASVYVPGEETKAKAEGKENQQQKPKNSVTGKAVEDVTAMPILSPSYAGPAAILPKGMLGSMQPNNYEVMLEQKDLLRISGASKKNAEFDIILGTVKKRLKPLAEAAETGVRKVTDIGGCQIEVPDADSQSIGTPSNGRLENAAGMPVEGPYTVLSPHARGRNRNYGTNELVVDIQKWGCVLSKAYGMKLVFADMSAKNGGDVNGHVSHESGRDVDLGIIFKKGNERVMVLKSAISDGKVSPDFDAEANWLLIKSIVKYSNVKDIGLDAKLSKAAIDWAEANEPDKDSIKIAKSKFRPWKNHHHHYHIRIECPEGDSQCRA